MQEQNHDLMIANKSTKHGEVQIFTFWSSGL